MENPWICTITHSIERYRKDVYITFFSKQALALSFLLIKSLIKLNNYVFDEFDFYIDIALTDSYIKMLEPLWLGVRHKVKNINLNDLINTIKDEETQTLEYISNKSRNKEYSPMKLINKLLDEKSELTTKILNKFKENKNQDIALIYNIKHETLELYDFIDCNVINVVEPPLTIKDFIVISIFKANEKPIIDKLNNIIENLERKLYIK